jgi:hypothetical protein
MFRLNPCRAGSLSAACNAVTRRWIEFPLQTERRRYAYDLRGGRHYAPSHGYDMGECLIRRARLARRRLRNVCDRLGHAEDSQQARAHSRGDAQTRGGGPELRALRQLQREWASSPYLFVSERGGSMTASNVRKLFARAGTRASIAFPVHPHMLRHACGFKLANDGHDTRALQHYLGHKKNDASRPGSRCRMIFEKVRF